MRIALIVSEYHAFVTDGLERGAREALSEQGIAVEAVERFAVPGAFELAQAASRVAASGRFAAVICLGCLIRGETAHFDYIAQAASQGIMRAAQRSGVPVSFGLLTTATADEALSRSGEGDANKGREAARAAIAMARLYAGLERTS
jgi:6,7-dimethyl-8-ribityllumazine synthase